MTVKDMLKIVEPEIHLLDLRAKVFIRSSWKWKKYATPVQVQYLQACYDRVVERKYGVEPMGTDREHAAGRAKRKARNG